MNNKIKNLLSLGKLHLLYCAAFALLVSATGIARSKTPQDFIFQALFLPVTAFFFFAFLKQLKNQNDEKTKRNNKFVLFAVIIFMVLILIAFMNILSA